MLAPSPQPTGGDGVAGEGGEGHWQICSRPPPGLLFLGIINTSSELWTLFKRSIKGFGETLEKFLSLDSRGHINF